MKSKAIIFLLALSVLLPLASIKAASTSNLNGRILLQVESKGEAWYVNPKDGKRYYMANGDQAFQIMKTLGIGINNKDVERMKTDATYRKKFIGKILLQVESKGEAYYISSDGRYNYLKDGASAYQVMRKLGLGVSNANLKKIAEYKTNNQSQAASATSIKTSAVNPTSSTLPSDCPTDQCLVYLAIIKQDYSVCDYIKNYDNKGICLIDLAVNKYTLAIMSNKEYTEYKSPCDVLNGQYPNLYCEIVNGSLNYGIKEIADRDSKTIGDVKKIQAALELYYTDNSSFPVNIDTLTNKSKKVYISNVPAAIKGTSLVCSANYSYKYTYIGSKEYKLTYCLDGDASTIKSGFKVGVGVANQIGIR